MLTEIAPSREVSPKKMLISAEDYQRMGAAGIFEGKPRVELIDGEIFTRSPLTPSHNGHVDKASAFLTVNLFGKANIRTQGSVRTDDYSEPEPDITVLRFKENFYIDKHPTAADILLIVEVAIFSLQTDRNIKKKKYAAAGIPEYWIVIPQKQIIEVYKKPEDGTYREKANYQKTDAWVFEAFDLEVKGADLLV